MSKSAASRAPAPAPPTHGMFLDGADALNDALLDSRQRWRDLVTLAADLAFETDAAGRFVFVAPDPALGWPAGTLLGQPAGMLLAEAGSSGCFDPFRPDAPMRRRRAWIKRPDGSAACLSFATAPLLDGKGAVIGCRGVGQDVSEQERRDAEAAAALRRAQVLDHILARMRAEVLAPRMMQAALEPLALASGSEGVAVIDAIGNGIEPTILHAWGSERPGILAASLAVLAGAGGETVAAEAQDGRKLLVCPAQTRFGEQIGLVLWREPGARPWDQDDHVLASSSGAIVRVVLEHEAIQREMARQARTDPLTGLLNRRAFMDELARHIDRLEREGLPGALLFVDLDNFKELNDSGGHERGDEALLATARLLREHSRPTDLVARFGGDEFALWLDGADEFAAAERAEQLRTIGPRALAELTAGLSDGLTMSIGIAVRWSGQGEEIDSVLHRADQAMYAVKRAGRGHWRVARAAEGA